MSKSGIAWTEKTWNPVTGCTKVSAGCKHCYAEREVADRWSKNPKSVFFGRSFTDVQCHENQLAAPMKWKASLRIFVCPRADLFHEAVPVEFLDRIFAVMALAPQHTFQVLTKRPDRMQDYCKNFSWHRVIQSCTGTDGISNIPRFTLQALQHHFGHLPASILNFKRHDSWPLPNVWLGVTVENQEAADERIPLLLETPAAVRWISVEPLLGAIDLTKIQWPGKHKVDVLRRGAWDIPGWHAGFANHGDMEGIDWVVCGGESGSQARPMHPDWARALRDQCAAAEVPFLFKQVGEFVVPEDGEPSCRVCGCTWNNACQGGCSWVEPDLCSACVGESVQSAGRAVRFRRVGIKAAGRLLDGVLHDEYPSNVLKLNP